MFVHIYRYIFICANIYIYIHKHTQESFVKDGGTLFIIFNFIFFKTLYFSSVRILIVKELFHIFCSSSFDHTFDCHQG